MNDCFAIRARWIFPVVSPPISDGVLTIADGRIAAIGENLSGKPPHDLGKDGGDVALLPGLVNAHTHLEFSDLPQPLGDSGIHFPDWIRLVIAQRRSLAESPEATTERRRAATAKGLQESLDAGVTSLGEIAASGWPLEPFTHSPINCVVFQELLGLSLNRMPELLSAASDYLTNHLTRTEKETTVSPLLLRGLSPHAPYTVSPELALRAADLCAQHRAPLAMHLAETKEELELLRSHSGPFVELLEELEAWDAHALPRGLRPLDYLQRLSSADRVLIIHGNYLTDDEIQFLAERREKMSVVYCPRTHAWFGHDRYPLKEMLSAGVRVALGTDSRASNPDLQLLEEMRFVARLFDLPGEQVLRMGTLHGALAWGQPHRGMLAKDAPADLAVVRLDATQSADPYELLLHSEAPVCGVFARGVYHRARGGCMDVGDK